MNQITPFWGLIYICLFCSLAVQGQEVHYPLLLEQLELELQEGKTRAIRDISTLLNQPEAQKKAEELLKKYTLFSTEEIDFSGDLDRAVCLSFYYQHDQKIRFSTLLKAFYCTPIEQQDSWFNLEKNNLSSQTDKALHLRRATIALDNATSQKNEKIIAEQIDIIIDLKLEEGYKLLLNYLKINLLQNKKIKSRAYLILKICSVLIHYPTDESLDVVLIALQKELLSQEDARPILAKITNLAPDAHQADLASTYRFWQDSLGDVAAMQKWGYQRLVPFSPTFFEFPVDYYGRVLSIADSYPWLRHHALRDIVHTEHPRALFYIASQVYQYRDVSAIDKSVFVKIVEDLTELHIKLEGSTAKTIHPNWQDDIVAQRNYITYWAAHYEDYEWDDIRKSFINKTEQLELTENYERLFRRLNSQNDSVAVQAWLLLSEGDPVEVVGLANKYKELLRNYNKSLPSFKYRYLEQLVQLTDFCRRNNIHYKPSPKLAHWLSQLAALDDEKKRYQIENRIINTLTLDEITAVEYWGLLNEKSSKNSFSVGRILDWYYSENWWRITQNEEQLRLYLKKSALLQEIGVIGVCNHYSNKFGFIYPDLKKRLNDLLRVEADPDIIRQINLLLTNYQEEGTLVAAFIETPKNVKPSEIRQLPPPSTQDYALLNTALMQAEDSELRLLLDYSALHADITLVPSLFTLLGRGMESKKVMTILSKIFNHKIKKTEDWLMLWEASNGNYQKWEQQFFQEKIALLKSDEPLKATQLNAIINSKYYSEEKYKKLIVSNLHRLKSPREIRRLRISPKLTLPNDLIYFENLPLGEKELDNIPRLFELTEIQAMMDFLIQKSTDFDVDTRGSFFNNLFRDNWFVNYINDGNLPDEQAMLIRTVLDTYLNESVLISEFEEQATVRNIALLDIAKMPLQAKLETTMQLAAEGGEEAVVKIQEAILARVTYDEIGIVATYFLDLQALNRYNFLNKDFGLPVFNLNTIETKEEVLALHEQYKDNPAAFYAHYLDAFNIDYRTKKGELDFNKIYRILKYDIVSPFVGDGGTKRDYFTYGLIKLLEWHFDTRLDFHPKLNENQNFYSFSASKRAEAWLEYLEEKQLIEITEQDSPSFNQTSVE